MPLLLLIKLQSKEILVENFRGATSLDILYETEEHLEINPVSFVIQVGTNDLTNDTNLLNNVNKI